MSAKLIAFFGKKMNTQLCSFRWQHVYLDTVFFNTVSFEVLLYTLWDCFPSEQLNCMKKKFKHLNSYLKM